MPARSFRSLLPTSLCLHGNQQRQHLPENRKHFPSRRRYSRMNCATHRLWKVWLFSTMSSLNRTRTWIRSARHIWPSVRHRRATVCHIRRSWCRIILQRNIRELPRPSPILYNHRIDPVQSLAQRSPLANVLRAEHRRRIRAPNRIPRRQRLPRRTNWPFRRGPFTLLALIAFLFVCFLVRRWSLVLSRFNRTRLNYPSLLAQNGLSRFHRNAGKQSPLIPDWNQCSHSPSLQSLRPRLLSRSSSSLQRSFLRRTSSLARTLSEPLPEHRPKLLFASTLDEMIGGLLSKRNCTKSPSSIFKYVVFSSK